MTKTRSPNLEAAVNDTYNKSCIVHKQIIVHGGKMERAIVWIEKDSNEVIIIECFDQDDTCYVEVKHDGDNKNFYQGKWSVGKPGTEDDYHNFNAYVKAEQYAMGLI